MGAGPLHSMAASNLLFKGCRNENMFLHNNGVPGDWITGNRMVDVLLLSLAVSLLFPLLRSLLQRSVYLPAAVAICANAPEGSTKLEVAEQLAGTSTKWTESCWKFTVYFIFTVAAFTVSFNEPWLLDPSQFFAGISQGCPLNYYVPLKMTLFYSLRTGFYLQALHYLMCVEVRRKDWALSWLHHCVTLLLLYFSWRFNATRSGVVIMLIHDVSDVFLHAAKLARYAGQERLAVALFFCFALSWVALRVVAYYWVVFVRLVPDIIAMVSIPYDVHPQPIYAVACSALLLLYMLQLIWTYYVLQAVVQQLRTGMTSDVRESSKHE